MSIPHDCRHSQDHQFRHFALDFNYITIKLCSLEIVVGSDWCVLEGDRNPIFNRRLCSRPLYFASKAWWPERKASLLVEESSYLNPFSMALYPTGIGAVRTGHSRFLDTKNVSIEFPVAKYSVSIVSYAKLSYRTISSAHSQQRMQNLHHWCRIRIHTLVAKPVTWRKAQSFCIVEGNHLLNS
jgi:hypothetical protein